MSSLAFAAVVINTGVVIDPDKVKLHALVNEKHALSNGSVGSRSIAIMVSQVGSS